MDFDWVVTAQQARAYKPDERPFDLAFETIDVPRERILHVAQSLFHDHVTAKALGMTTVWIDRRRRPGGQRRHAARAGHARPRRSRHRELRAAGGRVMARLRPVSMTDALVASLRERIIDGQFAPEAGLGEVELATAYRSRGRPSARRSSSSSTRACCAASAAAAPRAAPRPRRRARPVPRAPRARDRRRREIVARGIRPEGAEHATRQWSRSGPTRRGREAVDADIAFHRSLVDAVGSPRLERAYAALQAEIRLALAQLRPAYAEPAELAAEHRVLLEAIAEGDAERAPALMREHLDRAVADLTAAHQPTTLTTS